MQLEFMLPEDFQYCSLFIFICLYCLFTHLPYIKPERVLSGFTRHKYQNNLWSIKNCRIWGEKCAAAFKLCRKYRDCTQIASQQSGVWGNLAHA